MYNNEEMRGTLINLAQKFEDDPDTLDKIEYIATSLNITDLTPRSFELEGYAWNSGMCGAGLYTDPVGGDTRIDLTPHFRDTFGSIWHGRKYKLTVTEVV